MKDITSPSFNYIALRDLEISRGDRGDKPCLEKEVYVGRVKPMGNLLNVKIRIFVWMRSSKF